MSNPILELVEKHAGPDAAPRLKQLLLGLVGDFWKDTPCRFPVFELKLGGHTLKIPNLLKPEPLPAETGSPPAATPQPAATVETAAATALWHALPGEIAEKMWGDGHMLPAGEVVADMLVASLGPTKDKSLLDLSAGLGGSLRHLAGRFHQIKGCETDAAIAARGMDLSAKAGKAKQAPIEAYDPAQFSIPSIYDAVLARELFYRIADKPRFFYSVATGIKLQGQIAFADYIVEMVDREKSAIKAWQTFDKDAKPLSLEGMSEAWGKAGFEIRVSEDQTALYKTEIAKGLRRFAASMRLAPPPDPETKKIILRDVESWVRRMAAIEQGMKFYRFHAVKA